ncbi:50S ribosomal protein L15 [uncultured archaeon]|nr:50S ribosomal protein L15 [uncultured archaeon]
MARRKPARYNKFLATRTWGAGNTKNRRGKGSRGGKGYAGSHKHRWAWILKYEPEHFGRHGFVNRNASPKLDATNISAIESQALGGKLKKEGGMLAFDFNGKILGAGNITMPVHVKAKAFSESAKAKIEKAGGKIELKGSKLQKEVNN